MPSLPPVQLRAVEQAVAAGVERLLQAQAGDGLWPDFDLEPGASDAWTTACVSLALAEVPVVAEVLSALGRAADALHRMHRSEGWGYNRRTAVDADSTAWALRFLALIDDLRAVDGRRALTGFLDLDGHVHTFRGDRFGAWSGVHADVAPVVGLALHAVGAGDVVVRTPPPQPEHDGAPQAPWQAFWWACDAYAVARNLELCRIGNGVPRDLARRIAGWLDGADGHGDAFCLSQLLACAVTMGHGATGRLVGALLERQQACGGWPATTLLRVPAQHSTARSTPTPPGGALFVTALSVLALKGVLRFEAGGAADRDPS